MEYCALLQFIGSLLVLLVGWGVIMLVGWGPTQPTASSQRRSLTFLVTAFCDVPHNGIVQGLFRTNDFFARVEASSGVPAGQLPVDGLLNSSAFCGLGLSLLPNEPGLS